MIGVAAVYKFRHIVETTGFRVSTSNGLAARVFSICSTGVHDYNILSLPANPSTNAWIN